MKFDEKLQNLRKASSLSQEQLADKLGVSRQAVSKWESGTSYPEMDKLIGMCKIFNCSFDDLVNDEATDKTIIKNKSKRVGTYIDSLLEFITKTINMFCSMKFSSLIRCILELIIIGCIMMLALGCIMALSKVVLSVVFDFIPNGEIKCCITDIFSSLIFLVSLAIIIIAFMQIFKARYLDYYDKLVYSYDQSKKLNDEETQKKEDVKDEKTKSELKVKYATEKSERIIIRDPEHRPLAFLNPIAKAIMLIIKLFVLAFSMFFILSFIFFVGLLVVDVSLIPTNLMFVGFLLGLIAIIVINYEVLETVYIFIFDKKFPAKRMFIMFMASLVLLGIGGGISVAKIQSINFISIPDKGEIKVDEYNYKMQDDLAFILEYDYIHFQVDEKKKDITVKLEYNNQIYENEIVDNHDYYEIMVSQKELSINKVIKDFINDLKHNIIKTYQYDYHIKVTIIGNKNNIDTIARNISLLRNVVKYKETNGYKLYLDNQVASNDKCFLNELGIYECYTLSNDSECEYNFVDGVVVPSKDCKCEYLSDNEYYCSKINKE